MLRAPFAPACLAALLATIGFPDPARAQNAASAGSLHEMPLPGGLERAVAATGERVSPDRSQFLVDFIRRTYNRPLSIRNKERDAALQQLLGGIDGSSGAAAPRADTLPLPLPTEIWIRTVFGGRETAQTLPGALLRSRGAALFYYGLLSLDDRTRAWLAGQPQLIAELAGERAAAFVVAAPGLRIDGTAVDVPGGDAARPAWEALVGHRAADAAGFTRALLEQDHGRLAYFFGTMAQLTPGQLHVALGLESRDPASRVAAAHRLRAVFERVTPGWHVDLSVFWRPALEPALLIANLRRDSAGRPVVPGTRQFWTAVFADEHRDGSGSDGRAGSSADAPDFAWLCEQIFSGSKDDDRRRYHLALFVSRLAARNPQWPERDAVAAVRAVYTFPTLITSLERAGLTDVAAFAAAARGAEKLAAIRDRERAARALAQFQGMVALVTRSASRGALRPDALAASISSLSAVELDERGDYEGRLVRWLTAWLDAHVDGAPAMEEMDVRFAGPMERDAVAALAGRADAEPQFVEWEGTRYRLDFPRAEALRIARLLGDASQPFLSSARALVAMADAIGRRTPTAEQWQEHARALETMAAAVGWDRADAWEGTDVRRRYLDAGAALKRAAQTPAADRASSLTPIVLSLADDLLARGLMELAYAVALGQPDRAAISADEAARRHEFGRTVVRGRRSDAWDPPLSGVVSGRDWHVSGSVLGLDLLLADFSLLRLSSRPPLGKPTLAEDQQRLLVESVVLVGAASLNDKDGAALVSAIRTGRARLAAARTAADADMLADEIRLSSARRTLLSWAIANDRERVPAFLSMSELLWLGLETAPVADGLHAWGSPAGPRTGCQCLELADRQAWETHAGRWHSGAVVSGFPDLNLRLAELLHDLHMPARLLAPVLAAATRDLVDTAAARDPDDRRALLDFVQTLRAERVEQYLALLTADGPLVPVDSGGAR